MAEARPLEGRNIVVTRPAGQATHLADALIERGAKPILFPVLAIFDVDDPAPLQEIAIRLDEFDWACFVSPNAVEKALGAILVRRDWPAGLRAATVGKSSEMALAKFGVEDVVAPQGKFDSEALLDLPDLQDVAGKRVVIFRGDGGRELLGDTLKQRGAEVEYVACYRRDRPALDPAPLIKLWGDGRLDAVTVTSSEGLRNLVDMVGKLGQTWLKKTPLFVPHQRIAGLARALGCHEVNLTGPGDDGLIAGLLEYYRDHARVA
ncbi:MAG: uroporphyrinogen-III synthase [Gammaproteobacteria bacterium]|nr:uroporphyrinogen-III synthase [Gammaproteobacteria bacterium]MBU1415125.1 uroporphyrinogen-III synthase [Gammaproteobacteria bacterium]